MAVLSPNRRSPVLLAALATALIAGCAGPGATAAAPASSSAAAEPAPTELPPADAVKAALQRLTTTTYSYTVDGDYWDGHKYRASGRHDSEARDSRTYAISGGRSARTGKLIVLGDDSYESRAGTNRWEHADLSRLEPGNDHRQADPKDPGGLTRFTAAIHSTRRLGPHRYEGEARLEAAPGVLTYLPLGAPIYRFERSGLWVTYTLTTDDQGNVISIKTVFETEGHQVVSAGTTFSNFGEPVSIAKPSRTTELRRALYDE